MKKKITKENELLEVIAMNTKVVDLFEELDIDCFGCCGVSTQTIEQIAKEKNLNLKELLTKINTIINK